MKKAVITCGAALPMSYRPTAGAGLARPQPLMRGAGVPVFPGCHEREMARILPVRSTGPGGMEEHMGVGPM